MTEPPRWKTAFQVWHLVYGLCQWLKVVLNPSVLLCSEKESVAPASFAWKAHCAAGRPWQWSLPHTYYPPPPVSSVKGHVVKVWDVKHEPSIPQRNTRRRWCPDERLWFIILNCLYNIQTFTIFLYNHIVLLRIGLNPKTTSLLYRISPWFTLHKNKVILITIILSTNSIIYKSLEK